MATKSTDINRSAVATPADIASLPDGASGTFTPAEAALVRDALRRDLLGDYAREVDAWRAACPGTGGSPAANRARLAVAAGGAE